MSFHKQANGAVVEVGVFSHEGKDYSALGSVVDPANGFLVGYVTRGDSSKVPFPTFILSTWEGKPIVALTAVSTWKLPRGVLSSTMTSYRATYQGRTYSGRGCGEGMLLRMRASRATFAGPGVQS